jgi:SAM-dependent methyltransferase
MNFNPNIVAKYLGETPIPLALERALEGEIYKTLPFIRPILDLGCGEGLFAKIVFAEKIDTGIDPNPKELKRAEDLGGYHELICCWGESIPRPDQSYATIFSNSVMEHIPDIHPVFREVYRLLKFDGAFYMTVPSDLFEQYTIGYQLLNFIGLNDCAKNYKAFFNRFWRHYHAYSLADWAKQAEKNGFVVKEIFSYDGKRLCLINDLLAPFAIVSFCLKKITNRWSLLPRIRYLALSPLAMLLKPWLQKNQRLKDGGLVFMRLTKS